MKKRVSLCAAALLAASTSHIAIAEKDQTSPDALVPVVQQNPNHYYFDQLLKINTEMAKLQVQLNHLSDDDESKVLKEELKKLENQLVNINTKLTEQSKVIEGFEKLQSSFDTRVSDISSSTNYWGILFTMLAALAGLASLIGATLKAKDVAKKKMDEFISENAATLLKPVEAEQERMKGEIATLLEKARKATQNLHDELESQKQLAEEERQHISSLTQQAVKDITENKSVSEDVLNELQKRIRFKPKKTPEDWYQSAISLVETEPTKALEQFNKALSDFEFVTDEEKTLQAKIMFAKAFCYSETELEIQAYDELINIFADDNTTEIQVQVAIAMVNKAIISNTSELEMEAYDKAIAEFADNHNPEIQAQVAKAMVNKAIISATSKLEIATYDKAIAKFADNHNPEIQVQVAKAMYNTAITLPTPELQIATYDDVISTFADNDNTEIQRLVTGSLAGKAEISILIEPPEQALNSIRKVEETTSSDGNLEFLAVMKFLRFVLDNCTIQDAFGAIASIPSHKDISWQFSELADYFKDNFEGEKLGQINTVVDFFEDHKDIHKLADDLNLQVALPETEEDKETES
ncbi:hypothetical protein [Veronia pacifica]|uniref:Uncharacterized protein n=1 Tax=Veronia pacifica TaxID=1080227 RepID=A0A1C3E7M6_9GAMM|nr:hypothetical protein A8L45_22525 [Veronia pacifica]